MSVNSILTNSSALSALQSLNMTEQNLSITQNQVSSGLAVANASQNAAYWSIGQQLNSDSGIVTATNSALAQSQAVFDTATSAINSVLTTIASIQTAVTEATNPGANLATINTQLTSLSAQLTDAIAGASFNGTNILNGTAPASMLFVSGFDASSTGGAISTIGFTTQALTGGPGSAVSQTAAGTSVVGSATAGTPGAALAALYTAPPANTTLGIDAPVITATPGAAASGTTPATADTLSVETEAVGGVITTNTYSAVDSNGNAVNSTNGGFAAAAGYSLSVTTTQPGGAATGILSSGSYNMSLLGTGTNAAGATLVGVTQGTAAAILSAAGAAFQAVTSYAATIGATQDRMTAAATLNSALTTNYALGVSSLVDADMNVASTRLQALQTQQQLGIQSLSIANQNSQLILKLFNG
jgi:flagellin